MSSWVPWIGVAISISTLLFTMMKFGREVHLDERREALNDLARCKEKCKELDQKYNHLSKLQDQLMEENRKLKEHNYSLMARITKLTNGDNS